MSEQPIRNDKKRQQQIIVMKKSKKKDIVDPYNESELIEIELQIKKLEEILSKRIFQLANAYMNESIANPMIDK